MNLEKLEKLFKIDDQPACLTPTQHEIFKSIVQKDELRVIMILPTQIGKSLSVALAVIVRAVLFNEKFLIVAPSEKKARIIMGYVIEHIGDNVLFRSQLEIESKETFEKLKRERSKNRLTFKRGGEVMTLTLDSRNSKKSLEAAMGFGVGENGNVVLDESSLIDDQLYASVKRMCGGKNAMLFEIGNPFYRNHFYHTFTFSKNYKKLFADYKTGIKEGRFSKEFIKEMRNEAFFDIYYECKFPDENELDIKGFRRLLADQQLERSKQQAEHRGTLKLGFDVGEGGDESVGVLRSDTYAERVHISKTTDLMATTRAIIDLIEKYKLDPGNCFIDATGIGAGVVSRLHELGKDVVGVKWGEKPEDLTFANKKAQDFWRGARWIIEGGRVQPIDEFNELLLIKYKKDTSGKVIIKSKDEMRKEGVKSPNHADAYALSFGETADEQAPSVTFI